MNLKLLNCEVILFYNELMHEIKKLFDLYFSKPQNQIIYYGEQEQPLNHISKFLKSIVCFDKPDGYAKINNDLIMFEHFEFDSSQNSIKKGSRNQRENARIERKCDKQLLKDNNIVKDSIKCNYSMANYINNAIKCFVNHSEKISSYKENLQRHGILNSRTKVETLFLIEDSTTLGNMNDTNGEPIILLKCDKFLDVFEQNPEVNYALCFSRLGMNNYIWFLSQDNIQEYRKRQLKVEEMNIASLTPQVFSSIHKI